MAKGRRGLPEINAASMADIAFLLLIFFLVTTTIDVDSGIPIVLPPMPEENMEEPPPIKKRNLLEVLVNSNNQLLVEDNWVNIKDLRGITREFLTNPYSKEDLPENPQKAVISIKNDRGTNYATYIAVQNELKAAYREVRDEAALREFGRKLNDLNPEQAEIIRDLYPQKISEAEPENIGGN